MVQMKLQNNNICMYYLTIEKSNSDYILEYHNERVKEAKEKAHNQVLQKLQLLNRDLIVLQVIIDTLVDKDNKDKKYYNINETFEPFLNIIFGMDFFQSQSQRLFIMINFKIITI